MIATAICPSAYRASANQKVCMHNSISENGSETEFVGFRSVTFHPKTQALMALRHLNFEYLTKETVRVMEKELFKDCEGLCAI
jgi:hypothetical protein